MELADTKDLKSFAERRAGSSPAGGIIKGDNMEEFGIDHRVFKCYWCGQECTEEEYFGLGAHERCLRQIEEEGSIS